MEIEAKFLAKTAAALYPYRTLATLAGFVLGEITRESVRDEYLDTAERAIYQTGYALRIRQYNGQQLVTLKGRESSAAHYSARIEYQFPCRQPYHPQRWPHATARYWVLQAIGEQPLVSQFVLKQERLVRPAQLPGQNQPVIALVSLDDVQVVWQNQVIDRFSVLEVELTHAGTVPQLEVLMAVLALDTQLKTAKVGKLARAKQAVQAAQAAANSTR